MEKTFNIVKFTGFAASIGTGRGWEENASGNRKWVATCGCEATSGAGAYGTCGSGRVIYPCHRHEDED